VLPRVPVRQWVLSLPHGLRYLLAWDHGLCSAVLGIYAHALLGWQRRRARRLGVPDGRSGSVTVIQRFGGALNLNIHFHTRMLDGVFTVAADDGGAAQFHAAPPPTDGEVAQLLTTIRTRILRLLTRRGLGADADASESDPLAEDSPVLAGLSRASVQGRIALGPRAGARLIALGRDPDARWVTSGGPRHAHLDGFDLHGNVSVNGEDRERLEQLCRYLLQPAVAQDRLWLTEDGRVVLELKATWADGTSHLVFEPLDLLALLAALTPRPRVNLIFYHGLLGPHGAVTLCILSSNTWNFEVAGIAGVTPWTTMATLQHLLYGGANGIGVERRRIDLPGGTRHDLGRFEQATRDESSEYPRTDAEPVGRLVQRESGGRPALVIVDEAQSLS
jgi:hypothetical protein